MKLGPGFSPLVGRRVHLLYLTLILALILARLLLELSSGLIVLEQFLKSHYSPDAVYVPIFSSHNPQVVGGLVDRYKVVVTLHDAALPLTQR